MKRGDNLFWKLVKFIALVAVVSGVSSFAACFLAAYAIGGNLMFRSSDDLVLSTVAALWTWLAAFSIPLVASCVFRANKLAVTLVAILAISLMGGARYWIWLLPVFGV